MKGTGLPRTILSTSYKSMIISKVKVKIFDGVKFVSLLFLYELSISYLESLFVYQGYKDILSNNQLENDNAVGDDDDEVVVIALVVVVIVMNSENISCLVVYNFLQPHGL